MESFVGLLSAPCLSAVRYLSPASLNRQSLDGGLCRNSPSKRVRSLSPHSSTTPSPEFSSAWQWPTKRQHTENSCRLTVDIESGLAACQISLSTFRGRPELWMYSPC